MKYSAQFAHLGVFSRQELAPGRSMSARLASYVRRGELVRIDSAHYAYIQRDGRGRSIPHDPFFVACRLASDGMISHMSALQYEGYLPMNTKTVTVTAVKKRPSVRWGGSTYVFYGDAAEGGFREDTVKGLRVTTLERTVIDCIATLKHEKELSDMAAVLQLIPYLHEGLLRKRLAQYNSSFVYQKAGLLLGRFAAAPLSRAFYDLCHGKVGCARDIFGGQKPKEHELDGYWRVYMPFSLKPTPDLVPPPDLQALRTQEKEQPELFFFDKDFDILHQTDMWMGGT